MPECPPPPETVYKPDPELTLAEAELSERGFGDAGF